MSDPQGPCPTRLTVIMRDDSPMIFANDSPSYRTVVVELTPHQQAMLRARFVGTQGTRELFEAISSAIVERGSVCANQCQGICRGFKSSG